MTVDELVAALKGRELSAMSRIVLDYFSTKDGKSRRDIFTAYTENLIEPPNTEMIDSLIATPQITPKPVAKLALQAVVRHAVDISQDPDVLEELLVEARRRVDHVDYAGKSAPDWITNGAVDARGKNVSGVSSLEPADEPESEPPLLKHRKPRIRRERAKKLVQPLAEQLGITRGSKTQTPIWDMKGDYLIFRYLFSKKKLIVSHMEISEPLDDDLPAMFCTLGGDGKGNHDFGYVHGSAFVPSDECDLITMGRVGHRTHMRVAYLTLTPKSTSWAKDLDLSQDHNKDLYGIRLSPGSHIRGQVSHRLWCSKILTDDPELLGSYDTYDLSEAKARFSGKIDDYDTILNWITEVGTMSMDEVFYGIDPKTEDQA